MQLLLNAQQREMHEWPELFSSGGILGLRMLARGAPEGRFDGLWKQNGKGR